MTKGHSFLVNCYIFCEQTDKLYNNLMWTYFQVSDIFSTFIKQLNEENDGNVWAKAYNNRGHAKYMAVNFDDALEDYEAALTRGNKKICTILFELEYIQ